MKLKNKTLLSLTTLVLGASLMINTVNTSAQTDDLGGSPESEQSVRNINDIVNSGQSDSGNAVDSFRDSLPEKRDVDILNDVQNILDSGKDKGRVDAFNILNNSGILSFLNTLTWLFALLAGLALVYQSSLDILYLVFPTMHMFIGADSVSQRTAQMANAQNGGSGQQQSPRGILGWVRSFFRVSDDVIQAMAEGGVGYSTAQSGGSVQPVSNYGGRFSHQQIQQVNQPQQIQPQRAPKHVIVSWFNKRMLTFIFTALALTVFLNGGALTLATRIAEFVQRLIDLVANMIAGI